MPNATPSRRRFLQQSAGAAAAPAMMAGQTPDRPPNIVSIICDQMRGDALSILGHPNVRTPNLDRMAREGLLFERCFVNNPVCLPSRKSCFSGRYPHEHGSLTNRHGSQLPWSGSLLDRLSQRGYRTGWVGKNHTYDQEAVSRIDFTSIRDREPFRRYNGFVPPHWHTDVYWPEEDCYPEVNTRAAFAFLEQARPNGDPFFLHVSYFDPHPPYMAPADYTARHASRDMRLPDLIDPERLSPRLAEFRRAFGLDRATRADLTETLRYYYAQIEWGVDKQVGRLLEFLEARRLLDNTIVVFTSDHGDFMGDYGLVRKGMFLYDALLHVPLICWAPGRFPAGIRTKSFAQHIDFFPTFADFAGVSVDGLPGRSLRPILEGDAAQDFGGPVFTSAGYDELTDEQLQLPLDPAEADAVPRHTQVMRRNMNPRYRTATVRDAEWRMTLTETREPELYRLDGGVGERRNVAHRAENADVRRKLERRISEWWKW